MNRTRSLSSMTLGLMVLGTLATARCSGPKVPSGDETETGGADGDTGGKTTTGGKSGGGNTGGSDDSGTGGKASGGSTGTGGKATGGSPGTGGADDTGGSTGTGGGANTGGSASTGGTGAGGTGTINEPPCDNTVDHVAPSINPPGGLQPAQVPMFIMLGFDDNGHADGINWVLDNLKGRKNADGTAALATFFISAGFDSDFFNPAGNQTKADLLDSWKRMKAEGHEIGNHSWSHGESLASSDQSVWQNELQKANDLFVNQLGVEKCKIWGFRTPFLNFTQNTFAAIKATGMRYDVSIEFGYDWWMPAGASNGWGPGTSESGKHYYWPFTLDNPLPSGFYGKGIQPVPGLWEIPVYTFNKVTGDTAATVTGLDFNLWTKCQSESSWNFTDVLKNTLDQRLAGNRSPFGLGAHTDIYSQWDADANMTWTNYPYAARRKALSDFIDYALTKKEVRFVTFRQLIAWMRKPTPL